MLLMTASIFDVLKPIPGKRNIKYYNYFIFQYTLITTSTVVAQCNLMPEMFNEEKSIIDKSIDVFINALPERSKNITSEYKIYCIAAGIDPGEVVQENESRVFVSNYFEAESKKYGISNRELVIISLNSSAFLQYFFLFESSLMMMYKSHHGAINENEISAKDLIGKCLMKKLNRDNAEEVFFEELARRSKFFKNSTQLNSVWKILNFMRNRQVHHNGHYDSRAEKVFDAHIRKIHDAYANESDMSLSLVMFFDVFYSIKEQVKKYRYVTFNNNLENLMRNFSLFIMESLYLTEKL